MIQRTKNEAPFYLRRSNSRNELSLGRQLEWGAMEADKLQLHYEASQADLDYMIRNRVSSHKSLRIDDGISGAELDRPGFQAVLHDVTTSTRISHVLAHRRDRLARPEDALKMATIERDIRHQGVTFVFSNGIGGPMDANNPDLGDVLMLVVEYSQNGEELRKTAERVLDAQRFLADCGHSTGGDAPYGFVRVLVDAAGKEIEVLTPGRRVREPGCHVRWRLRIPISYRYGYFFWT